MPDLREFLNEKAKDLDQQRRLERRRAWVTAVAQLIYQLRGWLKEADPERLLSVYTTDYSKLEHGLGHYQVTGLDIEFEDTHIRVIPIGRNVLRSGDLGSPQTRALGRVDISGGGRKYLLFLYVVEGTNRWAVVDWNCGVTELNRETFDKMMLELLS